MIRILIITFITMNYLYPKNSHTVEIKNLFIESQHAPAFNVLTMGSFESKKVGYFAWAFANEFWAEGYGGLTYMPTSYIQLGLGFGAEKSDDPFRIGSMFWVGKDNWSVLTLFESGGSGYWHQINAIYQLSRNIGIGLMKEEFTGVGPRLEFSLSNLPIQLWFSLLQLDGSLNKYFTIKFLL